MSKARQKTITFNYPLEGSPEHTLLYDTMLYVDANRLVQVLRNLISNALKFSPRGGTVLVSAEMVEDAIVDENGMQGMKQMLLRISVKDNGCGLSEVSITSSHYLMSMYTHLG